MPKLGISLYPEVSKSVERDLAYIDLAVKYGFKRVFTNLLSVNEADLESLRQTHKYARSKGMEVIVDVAPAVFSAFNVTYQDLSFFQGSSCRWHSFR